MTRWDVVLGGGTVAVLAVLTVSVVRSVREVLAVERDRRRRALLVTPPRVAGGDPEVGGGGSELGFLPPEAPPSAVVHGYVDDDIARSAQRLISEL